MTINIVNVIGDEFGVEADDGQKVFELISKAFDNNTKVNLSFLNIKILTTAFLNSAIGQLYSKYTEKQIRDLLNVKDISESGKISLKRVVDTAKLFYNDPDALKQSVKDILNDED